ncbi:hypothetical protein DL769_001092 [Monosporascus sp. CRB-8-3]|nr:hypothetical protein DL769_001092 [Monosporascus sp. CRB-8-3]
MHIFWLPILLALFVSTVIGWDPSQRDCSDAPLCLTSFKWCDSRGSEGCYFPDGVYSVSVNPVHVIYALLVEDKNYTVSWKIDSRNKDIPVRVQWAFTRNDIWETSTRDSQIIFNPREILNSFPLHPAQSNPSRAEAEYIAIKDMRNVITISQPDLRKEGESPNPADDYPRDTTDQFVVATVITEDFLKAQKKIRHHDEYNNWKLGVGLGAGLGAPILMAGTALGTWIVLRKGMMETPGPRNRPIEMSPVFRKRVY